MSDDDDMMYDEDYDEVDEEGENDGGEEAESEGVEIENQYYNSKGMELDCVFRIIYPQTYTALIEDSVPDAIKSYEKVVDLENGEKGEWFVLLSR